MPGVFLHFQPYPVQLLLEATKVVGEGAVVDPNLARMAGATLAVGLPQDLEHLKRLLGPSAQAAMREQFPQLSPQAIDWLANGERGISSNFVFTTVTGVDVMGGWDVEGGAHPFDCADVRRCLLLLESVPEVAERFKERMPQVSDTWSRLVENWDAIVWSLSREWPQWRDGLGLCPPQGLQVTHKIIRGVVRHGERLCCRVCGGSVAEGLAMQQTYSTSAEGTCSPAGSGRITYVHKCTECGHSF